MEKTEKFLFKLSKNERQYFKHAILKRIKMLDLYGLDVKPLKGHKDFYRVRYKKVRVIFYKDTLNNMGVVTDIDFRDKIYRSI